MGIAFFCPSLDDWDNHFDDVLRRSISFKNNDNASAVWRSISFNGRESNQNPMKSFGSHKMILKGSLSFNARDFETLISISTSPPRCENNAARKHHNQTEGSERQNSSAITPEKRSENRRYQAALRLQKVYKSFRTRRRLADCAVLVEQKWWKLLDFAELKRSSISFFDIEKPETATSRWSRARTRAAKVGKGLSKDEKARKLALQHWLEAIDPRHRYGHNLQFYYSKWLHCDSKQPFFYWLDIGEGKEVNFTDRCPRSKLHQQCIKYLGPAERMAYEVVIENRKFLYKQSRKLVNTARENEDAKWIFVLSTSKTLYVGQKNKGTFQHSSFLAGGATLSAGRLVVEEGILKAVWRHSGHYLPTEENFQEFMAFLSESNIDLSQVKRNPTNEENVRITPKNSKRTYRKSLSEAELSGNIGAQSYGGEEHRKLLISRRSSELTSRMAKLEIPERYEMFEELEREQEERLDYNPSIANSPMDGYETAEEAFLSEEEFIFPKLNLFGEDSEDEEEASISRETILRRINLHRRTKSYQLAQRLSSKWTTGAGPRIGCMRDYPSRLQCRVLEQANLSPRVVQSSPNSRICGTRHSDTPFHEKIISKSPLGSMEGAFS